MDDLEIVLQNDIIGGGTKDYEKLENKPSINGVELSGNKSSADLGITDTTYSAGENIQISSENVISATDTIYDDTQIQEYITALEENKVDKVAGKGLSTNDYTNEEKTKLASLENYDDTEVKSDITDLQSDVADLDTNKADKSEIPTKTSDITNDSGFIDNSVNNLVNYELKTNTGATIKLSINSETYVMTLNLKNSAGTTISTDNIDLPLETMVVGASYDNTTKEIVLTLKSGSTTRFSVADLVSGLQSEITSTNKLVSDLVDDTNQANTFTKILEITSDLKLYDLDVGNYLIKVLTNSTARILFDRNYEVQLDYGKYMLVTIFGDTSNKYVYAYVPYLKSTNIPYVGTSTIYKRALVITGDLGDDNTGGYGLNIKQAGIGAGAGVPIGTNMSRDDSYNLQVVPKTTPTNNTDLIGKQYFDTQQALKQNVLTAGENITIDSNNEISADITQSVEDLENVFVLKNVQLGNNTFNLSNDNITVIDNLLKYYRANPTKQIYVTFSNPSVSTGIYPPTMSMLPVTDIGDLGSNFSTIDIKFVNAPITINQYGNAYIPNGAYKIAIRVTYTDTTKTEISSVVCSYPMNKVFNYVQLNTNDTITGTKTFNTLPVSSVAPTQDTQFTNKKYVDDTVSSAITQYSTIPTADSTTVGKLIQYTGATDSTYTNGYFYIGTSTTETVDEEEVTTYSWEQINVQPNESGASKFEDLENVFVFDNMEWGMEGFTDHRITNSKYLERAKELVDYLDTNTDAYVYYARTPLNAQGMFDSYVKALPLTDLLKVHSKYSYGSVTTIYFNHNYTGYTSYQQYEYLGTNEYNGKPLITDSNRAQYASRLVINYTDTTRTTISNIVFRVPMTTSLYLNSKYLTNNTEQTVSSKKTFTTLPESSVAPTTDNQFTNKKYVDDSMANTIMTYDTMPTATSDMEGKIALYVGTDTSVYKQLHFYQCISVSAYDVITYRWDDISPWSL